MNKEDQKFFGKLGYLAKQIQKLEQKIKELEAEHEYETTDKFATRLIEPKYSYWHLHNHRFRRDACLTDIDRIWVEERRGKPVAVFDIKILYGPVTNSEIVMYDWFVEHGLPVYVVEIDKDFSVFIVRNWKTHDTITLQPDEYVKFVNDLGVL